MAALLNLRCNQYYYLESTESASVLFRDEHDYKYFFSLFAEKIEPLADLYAYCLSHVSLGLLIKIKDEESVFKYLKFENKFPDEMMTLKELKSLSAAQGLNNINILQLHLNKLFNTFIQSLSNALNHKNIVLQAELLEEPETMRNKVINLHQKVLHQNLVLQIQQWKYSSYNAILSEKPTKIKREELLKWFGGINEFKHQHQITEEIKI